VVPGCGGVVAGYPTRRSSANRGRTVRYGGESAGLGVNGVLSETGKENAKPRHHIAPYPQYPLLSYSLLLCV
jgi:hypothetical protein